jgi:phosphatidylglycerophosphate synthase
MLLSMVLAESVKEPCPAPPRRGVGDTLGGSGLLKNLNVTMATGPDCLPPWANWAVVFAMFVYQTLDAVDGKQARRTRSSSPLGQLFDHGCDAVAIVICAYHLTIAAGLDIASAGAKVVLVMACLSFFSAQVCVWAAAGAAITGKRQIASARSLCASRLCAITIASSLPPTLPPPVGGGCDACHALPGPGRVRRLGGPVHLHGRAGEGGGIESSWPCR